MAATMRAVVHREFGPPDVLQLAAVPRPEPRDHEIRVRVRAASVNFGDLYMRNFAAVSPAEFSMPAAMWILARLMIGVHRPRQPILGNEFSGVVDAVGPRVERFAPGDEVYGYRGQSMGAYAEYLCVSERSTVARKPANLSHVEAALVPYGAVIAPGLLRKVSEHVRGRVLVNGASGALGSAALQLAKQAGAHVTAVCGGARAEMVRDLGADEVIDYSREDFTERDAEYDLVFDVLRKSTFARCRRVLAENGRYLLASFKTAQLVEMLRTSRSQGQRVVCALASEDVADLEQVTAFVEKGHYRAVVDRTFPLERTAEAHAYAESGARGGRVVVTVD